MIATAALLIACSGHTVTPPPGASVYQSATDSQITEGEATLPVAPATAYATVVDYAKWSKIFGDIATVEITKQDGDDARVTFIKPDGNRDNLHFHNRPASHTVWFEDTGGTAEVWAEIAFLPGPEPGTTHVKTRLFVDVHGFASLFVTNSKVREMREQRVGDVLRDLRTYFARHRP